MQNFKILVCHLYLYLLTASLCYRSMKAAMQIAEAAKDDVGVLLYAQQVMYFMLWVCSLLMGLLCCN